MNWQAPRGRGQQHRANYAPHPQYQPPPATGWAGYPVNYNVPPYGNYPGHTAHDQYGQGQYYQPHGAWPANAAQFTAPSASNAAPPPPGEEVQASWLFKKDNPARPSKIVIIMRGLPGSGKTHLADLFKQLEIKYFGNTPRIISVDDYFMEEKEHFEVDPETGKRVKRIKLEYHYDPELFESYKASAFKTFEKTARQGLFSFIIVDAINSSAQDVSAYWYAAKTAGYEAYVLETSAKEPKVCATKNIHGRSEDEIRAILNGWEETPSQFSKLMLGNLLTSGIFTLNEISEVDMQADDDKDELGMDRIEELLEGRASGSRWSDTDKTAADPLTETDKLASKKRPRAESTGDAVASEEHEHKHKKSRWDVITASEGGVVKMTGSDMTTLLGAYVEEDQSAAPDAQLHPKREESPFLKKQREEQRQFKTKQFIQQLKDQKQLQLKELARESKDQTHAEK